MKIKERLRRCLLIITSILYMCACGEVSNNDTNYRITHYDMDIPLYEGCDEEVWVCDGDYAYAYHNNYDCEGLSNCQGDITSVSLSEAEGDDRTPCEFCY